MADFETAGYRLLSFKYVPPAAIFPTPPPATASAASEESFAHNEENRLERELDSNSKLEGTELPSFSSLMTSLSEIEGSLQPIKPGSDRITPQSGDAETQTPPTPSPPTEFHLFNELPIELRLKIWHLTFLPREVELRPTRPNYSTNFDPGRKPQWQSGCTNPAALSVSAEARSIAQSHYRIAFPLTLISTTPTSGSKHHQFCRTLYINPKNDTVCLLGQDSDFGKLSDLVRSFREADPKWIGLSRLALSVRGWGYGGSAVMMRGLGNTLLGELDQLVLFMYGEHRPPVDWAERGSATEAGGEESLERFRKQGNRVALVPLEGSQSWYSYRIWSSSKGRQFWNADGNIMRVGRNEIRIMELEFHEGW